MFIHTHDMASEGAKLLAEAVNARRIRRAASKFKGSPDKIVINWGSRAVSEEVSKCRIINKPDIVALCSDKLAFFKQVDGSNVRHVPFTTDPGVVKQWLSEGRTACARRALSGSGGEGLVLFDGHQEFVQAPLWTQYVKKRDEYRVHVFNGEVIDVQRKALKLVPVDERGGREGIRGLKPPTTYYYDGEGRYIRNLNYTKEMEEYRKLEVLPIIKDQEHRVRNLANGYIFMRQDVSPPEDVLTQAKSVFDVIPLDFGAVDVIWNERQKQAYVLEVNTAPGLEGSTIESYKKVFLSLESA